MAPATCRGYPLVDSPSLASWYGDASSIPVIAPCQPWNTATFSVIAISCAATSRARRSVSSAPRSASRSSAREKREVRS